MHLGVRQHQKTFVAHRCDHVVGHLLGADGALGEKALAIAILAQQHRRAHALRAQAADADALVAVVDGQPLGERHRRML